MAHLRIFLPLGVLSAILVVTACGGGGSGGGTTGTGGASISAPTAACATPAAPPSQGACFVPPGPPACPHPGTAPDAGSACTDLVTDPDTCTACELSACCGEIQACQADADCWACLTDSAADASTCESQKVKALLDAFGVCAEGCCSHDCWKAQCNPVTNEGCDTAAGEACDFGAAGYVCYAPPNDGKICDACDNKATFCAGGGTCMVDGVSCYKFCCTDADCGAGKCDKDAILSQDVGVCVAK